MTANKVQVYIFVDFWIFSSFDQDLDTFIKTHHK